MNDLAHFVPLTDTATIRGKKFKLSGIDIEDLGQIFFRFPEIARMIEQRTFDASKVAMSKQALCALIAAGCGCAGDEAVEKSLGNLSLGERVDLFGRVFKLTAPGGIGPFTDLVVAMRDGASEPAPVPPATDGKKRGKVIFKP
jgi:hypothetical protein